MNERKALLDAIAIHAAEDTPRLVYADWLEEHGEGDLDRATVEFIRASCFRRNHKSGYMPRKAYRWLHENWQRLIPLTLGLHVRRWFFRDRIAQEVTTEVLWYRSGRTLNVGLWMPVKSWGGVFGWHWLDVEFNRGFAQWYEFRDVDVFDQVRDKLKADQPFARAKRIPVRDGYRGW
ncbi:unnamed protein product [Gemmata massiliana]|uniref:TIGR02996 domain-containing protein n=1 Tax=Gemmata massiliana TaxID=1210884 RepID=A0A6P2D6D3_9BACT|nr:TIGR02996 domain-containing protein [Gemmata massiliana]VTR96026.1 unnamed protein product [Gemmata massiliana]